MQMRVLIAFVLACCLAIAGAADEGAYNMVRIVSPQAEETVHDNNGDVAVTVEVSSPLRIERGDRIALRLDGKILAMESSGQFSLTGLDRGSHTLQALVLAADGSVLAASAETTFYLWHASRLFPNRRR